MLIFHPSLLRMMQFLSQLFMLHPLCLVRTVFTSSDLMIYPRTFWVRFWLRLLESIVENHVLNSLLKASRALKFVPCYAPFVTSFARLLI